MLKIFSCFTKKIYKLTYRASMNCCALSGDVSKELVACLGLAEVFDISNACFQGYRTLKIRSCYKDCALFVKLRVSYFINTKQPFPLS